LPAGDISKAKEYIPGQPEQKPHPKLPHDYNLVLIGYEECGIIIM